VRAGPLFPIAALTMMAASPAAANTINLSARWTLDTADIPAHIEVHKGKDLFEVKVLPSQLVKIDSAAIASATGEVRAAIGGQFIRYTDPQGGELFCSTRTVDAMNGKGFQLYFRYNDTYLCLLDTDHDGKFDQSYEIRSGLQTAIPILTHGKDSDMVAITPTPYTLIDPAQMDTPLTLKMTWNYGNGAGDKVIFNATVVNKREHLDVASGFGRNKGELPGTFTFANLRLHLASTTPKVATADVERLSARAIMVTSGDSVAFGRQ